MAKRFIIAIDEFYDRNVKVIISAEADAHELYTGQKLSFEFKRTVSRLIEMRSHAYLGKAHKSL
jgi:cell division protein ZapE